MAWDLSTSPKTTEYSLRLRSDLEIYPQRRRGRRVWVLKDPLSLRYFQFREEEYAILQWLDGRASLEQIKVLFEQRFAPQRMTVARLHNFVVHLHRNALVLSAAVGQGGELWKRQRQQRQQRWLARLSNPLAVRFRGLDPQPLLRWLYPRLRWLFSPWCSAASLLLLSTAVLLVGVHFDEFRARLPEIHTLLSPQNLMWLAVALGLTKVLHELGHALTCKHFGGECQELGLMLLVFTPCLYCNVTDAWKLSSRWQRVAIAAAGIYVEVVLAAACALLWWFSQPGLFNTVCLNVVVVCSLGTVLLNGNPLLRYDGYYILSDLLDVPNLWQESRARAGGLLSRFFWGFDPRPGTSLQRRPGLLLLYAAGSMFYRAIVMVAVIYLLHQCLKPMGLGLLAQLITALVLVALLAVPLRAVWRTCSQPHLRRCVRPRQVIFSSTVLLALLALSFLLPLPCRVVARASIQPHEARRVYVSVPGRLLHSVQAGDRVKRGQLLARLDNAAVQRELESVRGQWLRQKMRVRNLESLRGQRTDFAAQLPAAQEILADLQQRQEQLSRDLVALSLLSPVEGLVLPPPSRPATTEPGAQLSSWSGTPLENRNLGCYLERQTLFCLIGQPQQFEAIVSVEQSTVPFVRPGQRVRLQLDMTPGKVLQGTVREVSRGKLTTDSGSRPSPEVPAAGPLPPPAPQAEEILYQAHVQLDDYDGPLLIDATGQAKIRVDPQSLSLRIYRFISKTFKPIL